jgi:phage terminase large subunit-like protein
VDDDGQQFTRYECVTKSWTTRERPQDLRLPMIAMWIEGGYLEESSGDAVDFMDVEQQILDWHRDYSIETWAYDVKFAPQLAQRIEYEGLTPFAFSQSHKFYTAPLVELLKIVGKSRMVNGVSVPMFKHDGNPCLAWQAGNLIIDKNARQELMPVKGQDVNKIDAMVAILMALSECLYHQQQSGGYWLTNKLVMGG